MSDSARAAASSALASMTGPVLLIAVALVAIGALGLWGAARDVKLARRALLTAELSQLRSHADRTVGGLEAHLEENAPSGDLTIALKAPWLREYWRKAVQLRDDRLYGAVVAPDRRIVAHSDPAKENGFLEFDWRAEPAAASAPEAFRTQSRALADGEPAIDVRLPVMMHGAVAAHYHVGLSTRWFDERASRALRSVIAGWFVVIGAIAVVVALACVALVRLLRRQANLRLRLSQEQALRSAERHQLVVGLAHEIRNPLNAIQINLHVLERRLGGLPADQGESVQAMLRESAEEVERIDALIRDLGGLAVGTGADRLVEDVGAELRALGEFLGELFNSQGISLSLRAPDQRFGAPIGKSAFRQVMMNLLENARCALADGGHVEVQVAFDDRRLAITVADDGPGVPADQRARLFEPFYTTRGDGLGLGLAIVRKHLEEAGGSVSFEPAPGGGARFIAVMPARRGSE